MLKPKLPQESFYGSYLYDRIVPIDHPLRKINQVVDLSFADEILKDRYNSAIGRPAEDPEFLLRLCLLQYLYGDSDRQVVENARLNLAYKYFLGLAVDSEVPDYTTVSWARRSSGRSWSRSCGSALIRGWSRASGRSSTQLRCLRTYH